jgi:hypothetical protein
MVIMICNLLTILESYTVSSCSVSVVDFLRVITFCVIFIFASYCDVKSREVDRRVWYPVYVLSMMFLVLDIANYGLIIVLPFSISFFVISSVSYLMYYFRLFYKADFKSLLSLSVLFPYGIEIGYFPLYAEQNITNIILNGNIEQVIAYSISSLPGYTIISNMAVFSLLYLILIGGRNAVLGDFNIRKPIISITTKKKDIDDVEGSFGVIVNESESSGSIIGRVVLLFKSLDSTTTMFYTSYLEWYREKYDQDVELSDLNSIRLDEFTTDTEWESDNLEEDRKNVEKILSKETILITQGVAYIVPITLSVFGYIILGNLLFISFM